MELTGEQDCVDRGPSRPRFAALCTTILAVVCASLPVVATEPRSEKNATRTTTPVEATGNVPHAGRAPAGAPSMAWWTVANGGGTAAGGNLVLSGTVGQSGDSRELTGGGIVLAGGFWAGIDASGPTDVLFVDGFETGDLSRWSSTSP